MRTTLTQVPFQLDPLMSGGKPPAVGLQRVAFLIAMTNKSVVTDGWRQEQKECVCVREREQINELLGTLFLFSLVRFAYITSAIMI